MTNRLLAAMALVFTGSLACTASPEGPDDELEADRAALIAGKAETRFPGSGYLAFNDAGKPVDAQNFACGITLIRPDVAVTAAHCVHPAKDFSFAVGFGLPGSSPLIKVSKVVEHPLFVSGPPVELPLIV